MSCNCNPTKKAITLDIRSVIGRLTSTSGVATASSALSGLAKSDYAYHYINQNSWLTSTSIGTETARTLKGVIDGRLFDYDLKFELKGPIVEATLVVREPFQFSVTLEVNVLTGEWKVKPGTLSSTSDPTINTAVGTLGCGMGCIISCLGWGAVKCILCGTSRDCWMSCLKDNSPDIAICIADCCK